MATLWFFIMIIALCRTVSPYVLYNEPKSWFDAQTYCRKTNSDLATVVTLQDNTLMLQASPAVSPYAWIGLFDDMTKWKWSLGNIDHTSSHFSNWGISDPNYYPNKDENIICVQMLADGIWDDTDCSLFIPNVCWDDLNGYSLVNAPYTWLGSQSYCKTNFQDLASVRDINEKDSIQKMIRKNAWIGLFRHSWTNWSDNTFSTFSNWHDTLMDSYLNTSAKFHCAMVDLETGKWLRASCTKSLPFICNEQGGLSSGGVGTGTGTDTGIGTSWAFKPGYTSKIKLRLKTDGNPNNAAIQNQILQQIHAKLKEHGLPDFKMHWTKMEKESIDKEKEECCDGLCDGLH